MRGGIGRVDEPLLYPLVALHRYSVGLTDVASRTLGRRAAANREIQVFLTINEWPGISPSGLARRLDVDRATVTRILDRLELSNVIRRRTDPDDHRVVHVRVTPGGRRRITNFEDALQLFFDSRAPDMVGVVDQLGGRLCVDSDGTPNAPMSVVGRLTSAGIRYIADVIPALQSLDVSDASERYALAEIRHAGESRPAQLAVALHLTSGGITQVLNRLESHNLVRRRHQRVGGDGRAVTVVTTAQGRRAVSIMTSVLSRHAIEIGTALAGTLRPDAAMPSTTAPGLDGQRARPRARPTRPPSQLSGTNRASTSSTMSPSTP